MKTKGIILTILLVCAIGVTVFMYCIYAQENVTQQEAYEIGKAVLTASTTHENPVIEIEDAGFVWRVQSTIVLGRYYSLHSVEISKRSGNVVKASTLFIDEEE